MGYKSFINQWIAQSTHSPNFKHRWPAQRITDLLLPDQCRICGAASDAAGYCTGCADSLPRHDLQCMTCGVPVPVDGLCGRCRHAPPPIVELIAPFRYAPPIREDIHALKYRRKLACGRDVGTLLARELERRLPELPDVLVPVPLHWTRQLRRGFNQAAEIALPVSRALDIPIAADLVRRSASTTPQVGLTPAQRRRNLRHAFEATRRRRPTSAAIIDDVITSGATVLEVARGLKRAGVERVSVWAVARA